MNPNEEILTPVERLALLALAKITAGDAYQISGAVQRNVTLPMLAKLVRTGLAAWVTHPSQKHRQHASRIDIWSITEKGREVAERIG